MTCAARTVADGLLERRNNLGVEPLLDRHAAGCEVIKADIMALMRIIGSPVRFSSAAVCHNRLAELFCRQHENIPQLRVFGALDRDRCKQLRQ